MATCKFSRAFAAPARSSMSPSCEDFGWRAASEVPYGQARLGVRAVRWFRVLRRSYETSPMLCSPPVADFHAPPITEAHLCIAQPPHLAQFGHLNVFRIEKTDLDILPSRSALPAGRHGRRRLGCRFVRNNW